MATLKEQATSLDQDQGYQEEESTFELYSVWDAWTDFTVRMGGSYLFVPRIGGSFSGFDIFAIEQGSPIDGMNVPKEFKYWSKLDPTNEIKFNAFGRSAKGILEELATANPSKAYQSQIGAIFGALFGRINDTRSALAAQAYIRSAKDKTMRTISGMSEAHKIVPLVEWFPQEIQNLDPVKLLSIFPEAEAKILMLVLGKALVGYSGCKLREGNLEHKARAYAMMIDNKGGLGKSTLMCWLREVMTKLGYNVTSVNMNMSKFGWGSVAQSDLALIDDLENDKLGELVASFQIKSLVTNGFLTVEEKGLPAQEVQSFTTVLGASNTSDPRHFFKMDAGSMSRLNQLQCYSENELSTMFGHFQKGGIYEQWTDHCKALGTTYHVLTSYLLARCAEYFLKEIGVSVDDKVLVKGVDNLQDTMEKLRDQLRISPKLTYTDDLLQGIGNAIALYLAARSDAFTDEEAQNHLREARLSPDILLGYIITAEYVKLPSDIYDRLFPKTLSKPSLRYAIAKATELGNQKRVKSYSSVFATITNELTSDQGFPYPSVLSFYEQRWQRSLDGCYKTYLDFKQMISDKPQLIALALRSTEDIYKELT